jgi:hypothetical protein
VALAGAVGAILSWRAVHRSVHPKPTSQPSPLFAPYAPVPAGRDGRHPSGVVTLAERVSQ